MRLAEVSNLCQFGDSHLLHDWPTIWSHSSDLKEWISKFKHQCFPYRKDLKFTWACRNPKSTGSSHNMSIKLHSTSFLQINFVVGQKQFYNTFSSRSARSHQRRKNLSIVLDKFLENSYNQETWVFYKENTGKCSNFAESNFLLQRWVKPDKEHEMRDKDGNFHSLACLEFIFDLVTIATARTYIQMWKHLSQHAS